MERTQKEKNIKKFLNRFISYIILLAGVFALCYSTKRIIDYVQIRNENKELEETLADLKEVNSHLEILNDKLKDKDYFSVYVKDKYQYSANENSITPID